MLFGKQSGRIRKALRPAAFLLLIAALITTTTACSFLGGTIMVLEKPDVEEFVMYLRDWSSKDKCSFSLEKGDALKIAVDRRDGKIALKVRGENGSEPYEGNSLSTGTFTVKVSETDKYEIQIAGKGASGKVTIKKQQGAAE